MQGRDMRICAECGREYDALREHECFRSSDQAALADAAKAAGYDDEDEYMDFVFWEAHDDGQN